MKNCVTNHVDPKGRLNLGKAFANATVIVEAREDEAAGVWVNLTTPKVAT